MSILLTCFNDLYVNHYFPEYLQVFLYNLYHILLLRHFWNLAVNKKPDQWSVFTTEMSYHPCVVKQLKFTIR